MKSILEFHQYKFNSLVFIISFCIITLWIFLSFTYGFQRDEGTLKPGVFNDFMANSFYVFRFPTHNLLFLVIDKVPGLFILFFPLLIVNSFLYTLITERFIAIVFSKKAGRTKKLN